MNEQVLSQLTQLAQTAQYDELLKQANRYLEEDDSVCEFHLFKSRALKALGKPSDAIISCKDAITADVNNASARAYLGVLLFEEKDYINALNACDSAILIDPDLIESYIYSGNILVELGYPEQAIYPYYKAFELDTTNYGLGEMVATMYIQEDLIQEGLDLYLSLVEVEPNNDVLHLKIGIALLYALQNGFSHTEIAEYAKTWYNKVPKNPMVKEISSAIQKNDIDYDPLTTNHLNLLFKSVAQTYDDAMELDTNALFDFVRVVIPTLSSCKLDICDVGCGTGLCGKTLRPYAKAGGLVGVDLCSNMLDKADGKKTYDRLFHSGMIEFLKQHTRTFDLITALDTFSYSNSLFEIFSTVRMALREKGWFIFSFRKNILNDRVVTLCPPFYYLFNQETVQKKLQENGFKIKLIQSVELNERIDYSFETVVCVAQRIE